MNDTHKGDPYAAWAGAEKRLQSAMDTIAVLRARVGELEQERDAVKETLAVALVALWKSHNSNDDDRDTVSDELASKHFATWEEIFELDAAALAKGAK